MSGYTICWCSRKVCINWMRIGTASADGYINQQQGKIEGEDQSRRPHWPQLELTLGKDRNCFRQEWELFYRGFKNIVPRHKGAVNTNAGWLQSQEWLAQQVQVTVASRHLTNLDCIYLTSPLGQPSPPCAHVASRFWQRHTQACAGRGYYYN